ncbi:MAG: 30S ribosomal protein S6 [Acidobacteriota bacterium]
MVTQRTYELGFIIDPRQTDDEVQEIADRYKSLLEEGGANITNEEHWGRRKLAYPINKINEGKYVFLYFQAEKAPPISEVERLMGQNDKVLRYLTVRTDEDLKRAHSKGKPGTPGARPKEGGAAEGGKD